MKRFLVVMTVFFAVMLAPSLDAFALGDNSCNVITVQNKRDCCEKRSEQVYLETYEECMEPDRLPAVPRDKRGATCRTRAFFAQTADRFACLYGGWDYILGSAPPKDEDRRFSPETTDLEESSSDAVL